MQLFLILILLFFSCTTQNPNDFEKKYSKKSLDYVVGTSPIKSPIELDSTFQPTEPQTFLHWGRN